MVKSIFSDSIMNKNNFLINKLKERKLTLAIAESMTCGMASDKLSSCKGVSDVLKGSIICYSPEVKMGLMSVKKSMIDKCTCESMEVTEALTKKLSKLIKADIHASITGLASPGGSETKNKPVGTVFFSMKYKRKMFKMKKTLRGSPLEIKKRACIYLYDFISKNI
jgi:nicotinamide-nucleotide amidase